MSTTVPRLPILDERAPVGMILSTQGDVGVPVPMSFLDEPTFMVGTCFSIIRPDCFLTAAHCIRRLNHERLQVWCPAFGPDIAPAEGVTQHEHADLAALKVRLPPSYSMLVPFAGIGRINLVDEFLMFGYPEHSERHGRLPVGRALRGYLQRAFEHESHGGYRYIAGELSLPVTAGLSGAPVFYRVEQVGSAVCGVATENLESRIFLGRYEESTGEGVAVRQENFFTQYGLALMLQHLTEWVHAQVQAA